MERKLYQWNYRDATIDNPVIKTLDNLISQHSLSITDKTKEETVEEFVTAELNQQLASGSSPIPDWKLATDEEWSAFVIATKQAEVMHDFLANGGQTELSQIANDLFTLFREDVMTDTQTPLTVKVTGTDHKVETHDETMNTCFIEGLKHEVINGTTRVRVALGRVTKQHAGNYTSNPYLDAVVQAWHAKAVADPKLATTIPMLKSIFLDAKLHNILDYYRSTTHKYSTDEHIKALLVAEIIK